MPVDVTSGATGAPLVIGVPPTRPVVHAGLLWVSDYGSSNFRAVDLATSTVGPPITTDSGPVGMSVVGNSLWVANFAGLTISRLNQS